ncbi:calcineurin-like phosphoesterase family protein [Bacteroides sedimenti]|uniref:Serine/threonine protein phosphatase n=1 Tax=Bacteroides sedimenti TaxID=2136147 RepID=A0ABM8IGT9_9BACE
MDKITKKIFFFSFWIFVGIALVAQGKEIKGRVTCNGKGISQVTITDGTHCTRTNAKGEYKLSSMDASYVYISTPSGYLTDVENTVPLFYQRIESDRTSYDFELKKNSKDDVRHVFFAQADVQLIDQESIESYKKILNDCNDLAKEYNSSYDVFSVDCGDILGDAPALYPSYIKAVSILDFPVYRAIGNHDMNYNGRSHETSYKTFEKHFGPAWYSFNKGKAHYVILNDNFFIGREYFYMGYLDERALSWLEQDLSYVSEGTPVFVIMHIPSQLQENKVSFQYTYNGIAGQMTNASALHELLKPYKAHIISGHMHYNQNLVYSSGLMEHITGAVCGAWWSGNLCLDGTPQGYGVYEVNGDSVQWYFKSSGFPKEHQMRVYAPGSSKEYPKDILVNVWNWDKNWKVEWVENGQNMGQMLQSTDKDPEVVALCKSKMKLKYDWISAIPTNHLFRATPSKEDSDIEIRVTDRFGHIYSEIIKVKSL